ncbi:acyl-CoA dehydrogenase family protein [Kitasatospora viridis]|uniref:Alkylation response protein AidB-like acyl-CoA dehydrogenase n=1 Tax=Kitasatospora viridis TaxID=281105 RepID=A0A561TSD1_9ACTN|nr:acyl-CoA dehydrogenase family protein [Kitasatospora viridis]TWF90018.1 alkylation response protein AidB-like acyl-CoA dehydrogenase [Kitasatospora viridis]
MTTTELLERVRSFTADRRWLQRDGEASARGPVPVPTPLQQSFHQEGLANWWLPADCGGRGVALRDGVDLVSELAYADAGTAFTLFISILGTTMVDLFGSTALRRTLLEPLALRGGYCATLASEEAAGSELLRTATVASPSGAELSLTGEKFFSTNADFADFLVVTATDADEEHLAVVVPRDTPGIHIVKRWQLRGLPASATYQVSLRDCRVPRENVLSGHGLRILEVGLNTSRILMAASAVGVARRIRDLCLDYAAHKRVHGTLLEAHPVFAAKLARIETTIMVMRNQCLSAAEEFDALARLPDGATALLRTGSLKSALAAKLFCGRAGWEIATTGTEMFGGLGYTQDSPMGDLADDMRYVSIVEGGEDVLQELLYTRHVLPPERRT